MPDPIVARPAPVALHRRGGRGGAYLYDALELPWQDAGKEGVRQKIVRRDDDRGHFLGLIGMEPMVRSGLHQHQGTATSFFLDGGLTDYHGPIRRHQVGINLAGATHDAIAWERTPFVARLEGPVTYPPQDGPLHGLHAGARHAPLSNPAPDVAPEINVDVDALPAQATGCEGVTRRTVFDYALTADDHRMVQLEIRPQARMPRLAADGHLELWVRGGSLEIDGRVASAGCFVVIEPGAELSLACPFGAMVLGWAEAPVRWIDAPPPRDGLPPSPRADLFGHR